MSIFKIYMSKSLAFLCVLLNTLLLSLVIIPTTFGQERPLLNPTNDSGTVKPRPDPTVISSRNVIVDIQLLREAQRILIPLFDNVSIVVVRSKIENTRKGFAWTGKVENQPGSLVSLSVVGNVTIGNIWAGGGKHYAIRYLGRGVHSLQRIDQSKFPPSGEPNNPRPFPRPDNGEACSTDPPTEIDVLVVYTDDARAAAGGNEAIEGEIYNAVALTNESYHNSDIYQRLRLVHLAEVNYDETQDTHKDRARLEAKFDGFLDHVHALRDTYGADVVVLIVETNEDVCGTTNIMETVSTDFESYAFAVVIRKCAGSYMAFAHELGHIMSARHHWGMDDTDGKPFHYNHGYYNCLPTASVGPWYTVMATWFACFSSGGSEVIPYWSNPDQIYPPGNPLSEPLGTNDPSQPTNNRLTLNNTALTVANFRCSSPMANNVWMKDTWKDTGAEPDPLTAGQAMWKSPYIWIRNKQDTNLVYQHKHQNPEFGQWNYIYVKLHNGKSQVANGILELYWAHASTGLSWPGDWTYITGVPVNGFSAHSTKIIEVPWNNLPGTGHYCLLARWNSGSEPMLETNDIVSNVRNSNNLVWRNLNIVDFVPDSVQEADFIVRNSSKEKASISLKIASPENELDHSFILDGQVIVRFDDSLMKAWTLGGMQGSGFTSLGGNEFLVKDPAGAKFENLIMNGLQIGRTHVKFTKLATTPKRQYIIDAIQYKTGQQSAVIGGVSYEIHTDTHK